MAIIWSWWKVNPNPCQPHLPIHLSHLSIQGAAVDSCYSLPPGVSLTNAPMILGYTWCVGISGYQINRLGKYFTASDWQDPLNKMSPWDSSGVSPPMIGHMSNSTMFKPTRNTPVRRTMLQTPLLRMQCCLSRSWPRQLPVMRPSSHGCWWTKNKSKRSI